MTQLTRGSYWSGVPTVSRAGAVLTAVLCLVIAFALLPASAVAQSADSIAPVARATVQGTVYDNLNDVPVRGAVVQLVGVDSTAPFARAAVADDSGSFSFEQVPEGVYAIGFFGSVLDSLGFEPVLQAVRVQGNSAVRADLSGPTTLELRDLLCSSGAFGVNRNDNPDEARGLILGRVRDAFTFEPSADANVRASWFQLSLDAFGIRSGARDRAVQVRQSGWYALCDVSAAGSMLLSAQNSADSTDLIPIEMPASGLLRRDLYLGSVSVVNAGAMLIADSTDADLLPRRIGPGRLTGLVVTAIGEQPLASARASVANGRATTSNANGQWTLSEIPAGTRLLDVRAVGFFPLRIPVDVVEGAPRVRVVLPSLKSVLDSVRIVAERNRSDNMRGFDDRRRASSLGRFLTPQDFMQRPVNFMSEIIATVPGVSLERNSDGRDRLGMRPVLGSGRCSPAVFIDGAELRDLSIEDLNAFARKEEVQGVEVYPSGSVPAQFSRFDTAGQFGCGAIVIWTR